jgi:hypothetical protein
LCPGVTGFHLLYFSVSVRRCSPVLDAQLVPSVPELNLEARTTGVLLTIDNLVACYVMLTSLPPFPAACPGTIR